MISDYYRMLPTPFFKKIGRDLYKISAAPIRTSKANEFVFIGEIGIPIFKFFVRIEELVNSIDSINKLNEGVLHTT